jgi:hypothetical protein
LNGTKFSTKLTLATERSKKSIRRKEPTNSTDLTLELLKRTKLIMFLVVINAAKNDDVMAFEALWKRKIH